MENTENNIATLKLPTNNIHGVYVRDTKSETLFDKNNTSNALHVPVKIKKINENATVPTYGTPNSAGADLYACIDESFLTINPGEVKVIKTGICLEIPGCLVGLIYARSGLSVKKGLAPANKVGVIDSDYRGEILVALYNESNEQRIISHGERIAQIVFTPFYQANFKLCDELDTSERGDGGFGSTGV